MTLGEGEYIALNCRRAVGVLGLHGCQSKSASWLRALMIVAVIVEVAGFVILRSPFESLIEFPIVQVLAGLLRNGSRHKGSIPSPLDTLTL